MLSHGQNNPIDFYGDYISIGVLTDGDGAVISSSVTKGILNEYKDVPHIVFTHIPGDVSDIAVAYARIDRETIYFRTDSAASLIPLNFLTYHLVFHQSGLPKGLRRWQEVPLSFFLIWTTGISLTTTPQ